jgi:cob(I)alamin adenosyltransferase
MTIYTRTGDQGETDLFDGGRIRKDTARMEACGDLDELDAWLGLARSEALPKGTDEQLEKVQRRLMRLRAQVATVSLEKLSKDDAISHHDVKTLERAIDRHEAKLDPVDSFILPAGSRAACTLHVARAVCRRAERRLVSLAHAEPRAVPSDMLAYVNRLSDLLFVLARAANTHAGVADVEC